MFLLTRFPSDSNLYLHFNSNLRIVIIGIYCGYIFTIIFKVAEFQKIISDIMHAKAFLKSSRQFLNHCYNFNSWWCTDVYLSKEEMVVCRTEKCSLEKLLKFRKNIKKTYAVGIFFSIFAVMDLQRY